MGAWAKWRSVVVARDVDLPWVMAGGRVAIWENRM